MIIKDIIRALLYTVKLAPKEVIRGYVPETTLDKLTWLQAFLPELLRKVIIAGCGIWLTRIVDSGYVSQGDMNTMIDMTICIFLAGGAATWTRILVPLWKNRIWPWIQKQVGPVQKG
jgi:hypothetical protein